MARSRTDGQGPVEKQKHVNEMYDRKGQWSGVATSARRDGEGSDMDWRGHS